MFFYCFRERETILDLFEMSSGQRMHTRYFQVGGVIEDIPTGFAAKVREFIKGMPTRVDQYGAAAPQRDRAAAPARGLSARYGHAAELRRVTGPLLRASGNPWDLRKAAPYCSYEEFDFKIPVGTVGDNYDRYAVRMAEIYESVKIIDQALDGLPEGPYITEDRKVALPPRHELATSMEALIHHFKLVTEGFRVPPGEVYYPIESPRGELGCFVRSDGSSKPARVHMRDPSFVNLQAFSRMAEGVLHRGPDRDAGDASIRSSEASTDERPGRAARGDEGAHGAVPRPPLRRVARAGGGAARARLVLAGGVLSPKRLRRSMTETILPRRLMTPSR